VPEASRDTSWGTFGTEMKIPSYARWSFVVVETLLIVFPVTLLVTRMAGWHGASADAALQVLFLTLPIGFLGMTVWLIAFHTKEPKCARIGFVSFIVISLLALLTVPVAS
jgi:hypothetical protein